MPELAIAGGAPVRAEPYPEWPLGDDEDVAAVEEVIRGGRWGGFPEPGPKAAAFEEAFAAYQGARHGVLMANGTVTMEVALKALGIGWGDEGRIIPALTFAATVRPDRGRRASRHRRRHPETWTIDPALVEEAHHPRTRATCPCIWGTRWRTCIMADRSEPLTRRGRRLRARSRISAGTTKAPDASATSARSATSHRRS
jgi:hypothetical protein